MKFEVYKSFPVIVFVVASISVLAFLLFYPLPFLADDYFLIFAAMNNPNTFLEDWIAGETGMYRPVIILSFALQYFLHGAEPVWYYLFNFIVHLYNTILLYLIIKAVTEKYFKISDNYVLITVAVYFFLRIQSLTNIFWISGRTDLISATFGLLALHLIIRDKFDIRQILLSSMFLLISLMSKETGIVFLPFIAVLVYIKYRPDARIIVLRLLPYVFIFLIYLLIRSIALEDNFLRNNGETRVFTKGYWTNGLVSLIFFADWGEINYFRKYFHLNGWMVVLSSLGMLTLSIVAIIRMIKLKRVLIFTICLVLSLSGLLIYYSHFPNVRLAYIQSIPLVAGLMLLISSLSITFKRVFVYLLLTIMIYSAFIEISTSQKNVQLSEDARILFSHTNTGNKDLYIIPAISYLSHKWVSIIYEYISVYGREGKIYPSKNKFVRALYYYGNASASFLYNINYVLIDSVTLKAEIPDSIGTLRLQSQDIWHEIYLKDSSFAIKSIDIVSAGKNPLVGYQAMIRFDYERVVKSSPFIYIGTKQGAQLLPLRDLLDGKMRL